MFRLTTGHVARCVLAVSLILGLEAFGSAATSSAAAEK